MRTGSNPLKTLIVPSTLPCESFCGSCGLLLHNAWTHINEQTSKRPHSCPSMNGGDPKDPTGLKRSRGGSRRPGSPRTQVCRWPCVGNRHFCGAWSNYQTRPLKHSLLETLAIIRSCIFKPRKLAVENQIKLVSLAVEIGDSRRSISFHSR